MIPLDPRGEGVSRKEFWISTIADSLNPTRHIYFAGEIHSEQTATLALIAVVGVDVEAEDGVDFDGLGAAHGRTELPIG
jgi:hypothetical protein